MAYALKEPGSTGKIEYIIENNEIREPGSCGKTVYIIEGNQIKEPGFLGKTVYVIEGNQIKEPGFHGKTIYVVDGNQIKEPGPWGKVVSETHNNTDVSNASSGDLIGIAIIGLIIAVLIAPFLTFKALPIWGRVCLILDFTVYIGFIVESFIAKKMLKNENGENADEHKKQLKISRWVLIIGFAGFYIIYGIMALIQYATNKNKYDYAFANFKPALLVIAIGSTALILISLAIRFSPITKQCFSKNKIIMIVSLALCVSLLLTTCICAAVGEASINSKNATYYRQVEANKKVILGDLVSHETYANYVVLEYKILNNTDSTVYTLKSISLSVRDKSTKNLIASATFNNVSLSGGLRPGSSTNIMFRFDFANGYASEVYWRAAGTINVTTTATISW